MLLSLSPSIETSDTVRPHGAGNARSEFHPENSLEGKEPAGPQAPDAVLEKESSPGQATIHAGLLAHNHMMADDTATPPAILKHQSIPAKLGGPTK